MFLDKTASKVKGYVNISVCGFFVERFLNLALKDDIKLWNLKRDVDLEVKASVSIFDYKKFHLYGLCIFDFQNRPDVADV